jgi:biotin carboxyl carrier protein
MANLPLAFAELLGGGILITAGISGNTVQDVFAGAVSLKSFDTSSADTGGGATPAAGVSAAPAAGGAGAVNPFALAKDLHIGRVDQGVDASMAPGSPILAPLPSRVVRIDPSWYAGQPGIFFQVTQGPYKGRFWYLAEQIDPNVKVGDKVAAGEQVATYAQHGTAIEIGWAANAVETLARATTGYVEGHATHAGSDFQRFLQTLGVGGYPIKGGAGAGQ